MIAVSESTPGPIMVNMATYVGSVQAGIPGAVIATSAVVLPSFVIILLVSAVMKKAVKNKYVQTALQGIKPCMIGIILATGVWMIIRNTGSDPKKMSVTAGLALVYFGSRYIKKISPIILIIFAAAVGVIVF